MDVILIENIEKLGKIGDVVKVKSGYARNYLLPQKKVLRDNEGNLKIFEEKKSLIESEEKKRKEKSIEIAKKIKDAEFTIIRNASENDQLYGSVTSKDIIKEIKNIKNIVFLNEQINLKNPIKNLGVHKIETSVYTDIKEKILINVAKTKESASLQLKEYKNPKKDKNIKSKINIKTLKKTKFDDVKKDLNTKDLVKEIEKKNIKQKSLSKKEKKIGKKNVKQASSTKEKKEKLRKNK